MISSFRQTTALVFAAALGSIAITGSASADTFEGCTDPAWTAFGDAVNAGTAEELESFITYFGPTCRPLERTAQVLLCQLDPASCLQQIEPAAGTPPEEVDEPYEVPQDTTEPTEDFAYRAPGEHLGWENDHGGGGSSSEPPSNEPSSSSNSGRGDYSPPSESTGPSISNL